MDFIRPIQPDRDVDPLSRVQRLKDEREKRERDPQRRPPADPGPQTADRGPQEDEGSTQGPVEGDDGHMHIDIRA
jgi:hypothetical protein